jgi:hypothetical protein
LHYWLMSLLLLVFFILPLFIKQKISTPLFLFVFGFSLGLTAQGVISYSDWFEVLTKID